MKIVGKSISNFCRYEIVKHDVAWHLYDLLFPSEADAVPYEVLDNLSLAW